jgi:hypothetical protein
VRGTLPLSARATGPHSIPVQCSAAGRVALPANARTRDWTRETPRFASAVESDPGHGWGFHGSANGLGFYLWTCDKKTVTLRA